MKREKYSIGSSRRFVLLLSVFGIIVFSFTAFLSQTKFAESKTNDEISPSAVIFSENFDGASAPQLPANWTSSATNEHTVFSTSALDWDTPLNTIFTGNPPTAGQTEITSPPIALGSGIHKLSFKHRMQTQPTPGYDGGVLEVSLNGGEFQDILAAGGAFLAGGYQMPIINVADGNPLVGRPAWTGSMPSYTTTQVALPSNMANQTVRFRWRYGTDMLESGVGWRIDSIQVTEESAIPTNSVTFTNPNPITINDVAAASPYPSTINVSNVGSRIAKITVTLNGFSHTFPDDVDVLLVGPGGQTAVIMSDVGGSGDTASINLTLDDAAATPLSDAGQLVTGTFQPTNITLGDAFPAPAPAASGTSMLSVFNDTNPNGAWRLFVVDDLGADTGSFSGGWSLTIINAISGENTNAISIPDVGPASVYPSEINVTNHEGLIIGMQVNLINFSHASPDDVDLMLVAPNGRKVVLMSDVGGANPVSNVNLTIEDAATDSLPDNASIVSGSYRPTDFEPGDSFPAPAPGGASTGQKLSAFNGSPANGTWQLFLVDDSGNNAGSLSGGWNIAIQTSADVITIPATGNAEPYPSSVQVTGLTGNVTSVKVTINNFSHTSPDDVDIMLVSPSGRRIVLMSDVGGNTEVGGLNFTFDDTAASNLPDNSQLVSGTFKPTDFEPGDAFPAPAPSGVSGTTLNAFYGSPPNGVWKLYIVDDSGENIGSIAGNWSLNIQSSATACQFTVSPTVQAFPITGGSGNFAINMPTGCSWSASTSSGFITINSNSGGDGSGTVAFSVAANMEGGRAGTIDVSNGVLVRTFQIQQPSGCPFSLNQTALNFGGSGGNGNITVTAGSVCSWQAQTAANWIQVTSNQQTGNGQASFTVSPNP
ncbi:MAG TPA: proprotein convertase P-domain-containing protein, partial [Pyrinomonadaceae bacterium]